MNPFQDKSQPMVKEYVPGGRIEKPLVPNVEDFIRAVLNDDPVQWQIEAITDIATSRREPIKVLALCDQEVTRNQRTRGVETIAVLHDDPGEFSASLGGPLVLQGDIEGRLVPGEHYIVTITEAV